MTVADLRSDTLTKPTPAMVEAMMQAVVGDDVFGEDPTVRALERQTACLLGKETGIFVPSGTMANQIALLLHTRPGDSVIAEEGVHALRFESGAAAAVAGVQIDQIPQAHRLSNDALIAAFRPEYIHTSATTMLIVENTLNVAGGRVLQLAEMRRIAKQAKSLGLALHCDGARLWNAAQALAVVEAELVQGFDTVAVCFSKGLGAPAGSVLCGTEELMNKARKLRKRLGGGMRQVGYFAAAALYALEHHRERLRKDHKAAQAMADLIRQATFAGGLKVELNYPDPGTNMVYVRFHQGRASEHVCTLENFGVRMIAMGENWLRAVFHLDSGPEAAEVAAKAVIRLAQQLG